MSLFPHKRRQIPKLNTASLPDLIFSVLFFFMIVTHMRQVTLKVKYREPQGTELQRLTKKSTVSHIYIGPSLGFHSTQSCVQVNDKLVNTSEVEDYMAAEKARMAPEDVDKMVVSIKADRHTPMGVITDVKLALRRAKTLKVSYSGEEKTDNNLK